MTLDLDPNEAAAIQRLMSLGVRQLGAFLAQNGSDGQTHDDALQLLAYERQIRGKILAAAQAPPEQENE